MAEALAALGHEVHVVTYHLGVGAVDSAVRIHRIRDLASYRHFGPGPTFGKLLFLDPLLMAELGRVLRAFSIDVVHAHHYEGLLVGVAAGIMSSVRHGRRCARIPVVYDAHTLLASELPHYGPRLPSGVKRAVGLRLDRWLPKWPDHIISVTEAIRDKLVRNGIGRDRITVVPNGVEFEHFAAGGAARYARNGQKRVLFTGNLARYQGIEFLLEAFAKVVRVKQDVRLWIAANSSFEPYAPLARALGVLGSIDLLPAPDLDRLPALLANADVTVNPRTECDGMPVKLLNYMAASRPVVSFAASAPGVEHRRTGWLVADADTSAFADGILTILDDPELAEKLGRGAQRYVEANCRWSTMAERVQQVYARVLGATG
jgi:glycosyltransferase involved in cell wall biosynthesis